MGLPGYGTPVKLIAVTQRLTVEACRTPAAALTESFYGSLRFPAQGVDLQDRHKPGT